MLLANETATRDEPESPRSLARDEREDADLDAPYDRARAKRPTLERLRVFLVAQPDDPSKLRALAWLDLFEERRSRCLAGTCSPKCSHPFRALRPWRVA